MIEYLNCDACNAVVSTEMILCEYCGNDFRLYGMSAELIKLREELDNKYRTLSADDFLKYVNSSKFKDHPILLFRKLKIQLIEIMYNDNALDSQKFCQILYAIKNLKKISIDYWLEFASYISVILPTPHSKLYMDDYFIIKNFLFNNDLDSDEIVIKKLREQVVMTELGNQFFKEYNFYNDPKNFVNNSSFIHKKKHLIEKYEAAFKNFKNQNI